jgi:DNA-binding transcriptional MerR regulator
LALRQSITRPYRGTVFPRAAQFAHLAAGMLLIGELAQTVGVNAKTIRYYEAVGLLPPPARSESGYRLYDQDEVWKVQFILKAKALSLTLAEIREILSLRDRGVSPCDRVLSLVQRKIDSINEQMRLLGTLRDDLESLRKEARQTRDAGRADVCSIIESHGAIRPRPSGDKRQRSDGRHQRTGA